MSGPASAVGYVHGRQLRARLPRPRVAVPAALGLAVLLILEALAYRGDYAAAHSPQTLRIVAAAAVAALAASTALVGWTSCPLAAREPWAQWVLTLPGGERALFAVRTAEHAVLAGLETACLAGVSLGLGYGDARDVLALPVQAAALVAAAEALQLGAFLTTRRLSRPKAARLALLLAGFAAATWVGLARTPVGPALGAGLASPGRAGDVYLVALAAASLAACAAAALAARGFAEDAYEAGRRQDAAAEALSRDSSSAARPSWTGGSSLVGPAAFAWRRLATLHRTRWRYLLTHLPVAGLGLGAGLLGGAVVPALPVVLVSLTFVGMGISIGPSATLSFYVRTLPVDPARAAGWSGLVTAGQFLGILALAWVPAALAAGWPGHLVLAGLATLPALAGTLATGQVVGELLPARAGLQAGARLGVPIIVAASAAGMAVLAYPSLGIWAVPAASSVAVALVVGVGARLLEPVLDACWG